LHQSHQKHLIFASSLVSLLALFPTLAFSRDMRTPQRIASCSLATDEIATALLTRSHHESHLIAVSTLADNPEYSNIIPVPAALKGRCGTELESLIILKPDLILLAPYTRTEFVRQVTASSINTFTTQKPISLETIEATIEQLGAKIQEPEAARQLLTEIRKERQAFQLQREQKKKPRLLHIFSDHSFSGGETMFDAIAKEAGAVNILAEQGIKGWPKLTTEHIAGLRPDMIVVAGTEQERDKILANLKSLPGLREIPAIKEGRLILIPDHELGSVSHHVLKAVKRLADALTLRETGSPQLKRSSSQHP
jgi:iron complex transport system substrate-binding protein